VIGTTLGHYRIDALLGSGGMGVVYRAFDTRLQRTVAIKVLQSTPGDAGAQARLLKEARSASALNHASICTVHEVGEIDGQPYIVMEHVDGEPLSRRIVPGEGLPLEETLRYGIQIAEGLAHAHDRGVAHRDLKSANVVVTREGRVKILDFGLAQRVGEAMTLVETQTMATPSIGEMELAGTPLYMAPEVLRGQPSDQRSDLWALGVVLFEMASGDRPFDGENAYEVTSAILRDAPRPLPAHIPSAMRAVIARCLTKDPEQRYQRASEVRAALEAIVPGEEPARIPRPMRVVRRTAAATGIVIVLAIGAAVSWRYAGFAPTAVESIAVVPLLGTPGGSEAEYLGDGISEGVINSLAEAGKSSLKVIALASVIRYKTRPLDPQAIGRDLHVSRLALLRVTRLPDEVAISAELVDVLDGTHLWGAQYSTRSTNLVELQSDIASKIAQNLKLRLGATQQQRLTRRYTDNIEAYQLYLRGRQFWYQSTFGPDDYQKAIDFFEQAIEKDPAYALAYSGLADTYISLAYDGWMPPHEAFDSARAAATKALALDSDLGEVHQSLAQIAVAEWDYRSAEQEHRRAIELNPNFAPSYRFYSQLLQRLDRNDEAIAQMRKALEVDPLGLETNKSYATTLFRAGRDDDAIAQGRRTIELDPNFGPAHQLLADVYERRGMYDAAIAEQTTVLKLAGDDATGAALARDYAKGGYVAAIRGLNQALLAQLTEAAAAGVWVSPIGFAIVYAKLGDAEHAIQWLERAYQERAPWLTLANADRDFDSLRGDARFIAIIRRIGLPTAGK
jgi:eukaryotic-like serine/threonine-protein kinase